MRKLLFLALSVLALAACSPASEPIEQAESAATAAPLPSQESTEQPAEEVVMDFEISSGAFAQGDSIPTRYSCDGENSSPALAWSNAPDATESFALIFDDPDAPVGTWIHWVVFDIPASTSSLVEAIEPEDTLADGSVHGSNSWDQLGYGGPCPPGGTHRYFFKLYALDTDLGLGVGATKEQVLEAMDGHVLAEAELMGTYTR